MTKLSITLLGAVVLLLATAGTATAQELPPSGTELASEIIVLLGIVGGLFVNRLTYAVSEVPALKGKIHGPLADLVTNAIAIGLTYLAANLGFVGEWLDASGVYQVGLYVVLSNKGWFEGQKFIRGLVDVVQALYAADQVYDDVDPITPLDND